ncbi:hypothetical protein [Roseospira navarrensis]|uniref:Uncharacterized protein n=1 Tax=Roseospira navarrensis TaxID=140058 RepID=A0A7X1ZFB9_9PROT|nr:hypothetical protein [Roseospira navarrensis]MQX37248.1 hypothetical protein [Roseospira navarrensis]
MRPLPPRAVHAACVLLVGVGLLFSPASARAEGAWTLKSDLDPDGGMNCSMDTYWEDGSKFSIFANANRFVGFFISDPAWSLQTGQESRISFRFDGQDFTFPVKVVAPAAVIGNFAADEGGALKFLERWAKSWEMAIVFPKGGTWQVNLKGTMATFRQWTACYKRLDRIARENGGAGGDGGGAGGSSDGNPF